MPAVQQIAARSNPIPVVSSWSAEPHRGAEATEHDSDAGDSGGSVGGGDDSGKSELRRERTWQDVVGNGGTSRTRQTRRTGDGTDDGTGPEFWPSGHRRIAYDGAILPDPAAWQPQTDGAPPPAFGRSPTASRLSVKQRPPVAEQPTQLGREPTEFASNSYLEHHKKRSIDEKTAMTVNLAEVFKVRALVLLGLSCCLCACHQLSTHISHWRRTTALFARSEWHVLSK